MKKISLFLLFVLFLNSCSLSNNKEDISSINNGNNVYSLFDLNSIPDFKLIESRLKLDKSVQSKIEQNYFAVVSFGKIDDFSEAYKLIKEKQLPILLTSDSLLHLFHLQFDNSLKDLEEKYLYDELFSLSTKLIDDASALEKKVEKEDVKKLYKFLRIYFSVGLSLLSPSFSQARKDDNKIIETEKEHGFFNQEEFKKYAFIVPEDIKIDVEKEVNLIRESTGTSSSSLFADIQIDYSQYKPRGHYTLSEKLKNYFATMNWYSKMPFLINGGSEQDGFLVTKEQAFDFTLTSVLLAKMLDSDNSALAKWKKIHEITNYYIGFSDDFTPLNYSESLNKVFPEQATTTIISNFQTKFPDFQKQLNSDNPQKIYGNLTECLSKEQCLNFEAGMRFFGQKYVVDSYLSNQLTWPNVGEFQGDKSKLPFTSVLSDKKVVKGFPRAIELMAVFGSNLARKILENEGDMSYTGYGEKFNQLRQEMEEISIEEWQRNLYSGLLLSLKKLLNKRDSPNVLFMQSPLWKQKELLSILASFAELKRDSILYAKQAYAPLKITMIDSPVNVIKTGYVEPNVSLYRDLQGMNDMLIEKLNTLGLLSKETSQNFKNVREIIDNYISISEKEIKGEVLSAEDNNFINSFDEKFKKVSSYDFASTILTADIYSNPNVKQVLQEATSYLNYIIVVYEDPVTSEKKLAVGPVMTYFEFKQPMDKRLNDEDWKDVVDRGDMNGPEWVEY